MERDDLLEFALSADEIEVKDIQINGDNLELRVSAKIDRKALAEQLMRLLGPQIYQAMRYKLASGDFDDPDGSDAGADDEDTGFMEGTDGSGSLDTDDLRYGEPQEDVEWHALMGGQRSADGAEEGTTKNVGQKTGASEPVAKSVSKAEAEIEAKRAYFSEGKKKLSSIPSEKRESVKNGSIADSIGVVGVGGDEPFDATPPELGASGDNFDSGSGGQGAADEQMQASGSDNSAENLKKKLRITCPRCRTQIEVQSAKSGSIITCKKCGKAMKLTVASD